ncbi:hypothetical protein AVEN_60459-1 [Araneus ventricosus]|uniref:Mariner Mos1 transposase n=1 Tax=Araneus ventricosus TaxID=182803 RepID=A0A4Y2K8N5_ARAVE|nr:hypothetical protein AVEN_60459-1 [Araneus ventricosus]
MLKKAYGNDAMERLCTSGIRGKWVRGKVTMEVFFDYDSVIHYEFIPEGQTVNKELYLEILKRLGDAVRRKRLEKWATNDWFLLHDNDPPHHALIVKKYLARHRPYHSGTPSLFSRPSTSGFLPVCTAENEIEGTPFCGFR